MSLRRVGGNLKHLSEVEKGIKEPGPNLVRRLARTYHCGVDEVVSAWEESRRMYDLERQQVAS